MDKKIAITGVILVTLAVILGAMGAHALKKVLDEQALTSFETGVRYQMYQGLGLLFLSSTALINTSSKNTIYLLLLIGTILFSGSIYLLSSKVLTGIDFKAIALATPLGGVLMIAGSLTLLINLIKNN